MAEVRANRFPGDCVACDGAVGVGEGAAVKPSDREPWRLYCAGCGRTRGYAVDGKKGNTRRRGT